MKKLTIAMMAVAGLMACTSEDGGEQRASDQPIRFSATIAEDWNGAMTRSVMEQNAKAKVQQLTDGLYLHTVVSPGFESDRQQTAEVTRGELIETVNGLNGHFGVSAYRYGANESPTSANFFSNVDVQENSGNWTTATNYTWPASTDKIDFYGYAPFNNNDVVVAADDASGVMKIAYTVNATPSAQADLMTAVTKKFQHQTGSTNTVNMAFEHQLTAIKFVLGDNVVPGHIKQIKFENIAITGTLTVGTVADYDAATSWARGDLTNYTVDLTAGGTTSGFSTTNDLGYINQNAEITAVTTPLLMIPQQFTQDTQRLVVKLYDGTSDKELSVSLKNTAWLPNTTVTYKITTSSVNKLRISEVTYPTTWNTASTAFSSIKSGYVATTDVLGVYAIDAEGTVVKNNEQLTKTTTGWSSDILFVPGLTYFAYYPYNTNGLAHSGTKNDQVVTTAEDFFANGISAWTPAEDQSSATNLNAQDLQVGIGELQSASTVSFAMAHTMGLAKVSLGTSQFNTAKVTYSAGGTTTADDYTLTGQTIFVKATNTLSGNCSPCWNGDAFYYVVNGSKTISSTTNIHNEWNSSVTAAVNSNDYKEFTVYPKDNTASYYYQGRFFPYSGSYQTFTVPADGIYKIECWGAQGGSISNTYPHYVGGGGGYVSGYISLSKNTPLYVYVGQAGIINGTSKTFNGGGRCAASDSGCASGGGATDIRLSSGEWYDFNSILSRIMVAGGGAGGERENPSGAAGGLNSTTSTGGGEATQTSGYRLGYGEDADMSCTASGAGGGYWGGLTSNLPGNLNPTKSTLSSAGGSSFISGHDGCRAIISATNGIRNIYSNTDGTATTETYDIVTFSDGSVLTYGGKTYTFTNTSMIDGRGYRWINYRNGQPGMPVPTSTTGAVEYGHTGNGYARIALPIPVQ